MTYLGFTARCRAFVLQAASHAEQDAGVPAIASAFQRGGWKTKHHTLFTQFHSLFLAHWPELSHTATSSGKRGWEGWSCGWCIAALYKSRVVLGGWRENFGCWAATTNLCHRGTYLKQTYFRRLTSKSIFMPKGDSVTSRFQELPHNTPYTGPLSCTHTTCVAAPNPVSGGPAPICRPGPCPTLALAVAHQPA